MLIDQTIWLVIFIVACKLDGSTYSTIHNLIGISPPLHNRNTPLLLSKAASDIFLLLQSSQPNHQIFSLQVWILLHHPDQFVGFRSHRVQSYLIRPMPFGSACLHTTLNSHTICQTKEMG